LSVGIFTGLLQYFPKNRAILVQRLGKKEKNSKSVSSYLKTEKKKKKNPMAIKPEGVRGARPLRKYFFLRLPLGKQIIAK